MTNSDRTCLDQPRGPSYAWWGIPLLRRFRKDFLATIQDLRERYGDAVYSRTAWERSYDFFDPEWVREALVEKASSFIRWERARNVLGTFMGNGILVTDGAIWQRQRRILQPGFSSQRMAGYASLITSTTDGVLRQWRERAGTQSGAAQTVSIEHELTQLTIAVIMQTLFSSSAKEEAQTAEDSVRIFAHYAHKALFIPVVLPDWLPHLRPVRHAKQQLNRLIHHHIHSRKQALADGAPAKNDLLGMLLSLRDDQGDKQALTEEEIRDECMAIFLAGHDTTAAALTWWCWAMAANPDCAQRASAEVDAALGQAIPQYDDVQKLPYLGQTLREAIRLYPPTPSLIIRRAIEAVQIGPWTVPKGSLMRITPYAIHHDPRWYPEPHQFKPERFNPEAFAKLPRGAYMPFGAGPRVCIGQLFATTEMTLIAAMLLQRFRLERADDQTPTPTLNLTLHPRDRLQVRLIAR